MKRLSFRQRLLMGVTLFSMFFGAGNLIFPPFTGYCAGADAVPAFLGLISTAVLFPVLGYCCHGAGGAAWTGFAARFTHSFPSGLPS